MYKQATQLKLRFLTKKGVLSVEQLWDLKFVDLADAVKEAKKVLTGSTGDDELSFLDETKSVNTEDQLRFDILKDVYISKKAENEAKRNALQDKEHNQKIMALIAEKKEDSLRNMSVEELEALLKK
jgi:hypothetical protein